MEKIFYIMDSTCAIDTSLKDGHQVLMAPLDVIIENEVYLDGVDLSSSQFMNMLRDGHMATTSQVAPGKFLCLYEEAIAKGATHIVVVTISSKLSGTHQSAHIALEMLETKGVEVHIFDSFCATAASSLPLLKAFEMERNNCDANDILDMLRVEFPKIQLRFVLDSVNYLMKSGRLSKAQAYASQLLNVKPLLKIEDGEIISYEKIRTLKRAVIALIDELPKDISRVMLLHPDDHELAKQFRVQLLVAYPNVEILEMITSPVVGAHIGPYGAGIAWVNA